MDVNLLRAILTTLCFVSFLLIVLWAYGPRSKQRFEEPANLPFDDQEIHERSSLNVVAKRGEQ